MVAMKHISSVALVAGIASGIPHLVSSSVASFDSSLLDGLVARYLQDSTDMTNSIIEGPVTLQQLELVQSIIRELSKIDLPDGVDLTKVNVAIIVTEVLRELGIDTSMSEGDLSSAEKELIIQEIIAKAAKELGVAITTTTASTLPIIEEIIGENTIPPSEPCSVCGDGMKVGNPLGNLAFEGQPELACGALETAGENGVIPSDQCSFLPVLISDICECIPKETEEVSSSLSVCSPMTYHFTINVNQSCETDDIGGNSGVGNSVCQILNADDIASTMTIFDVQFLEVDTSGTLNVINQDDTYNNVDLSDGDVISFNSISQKLNTDEPLSEQLELIPGGVILSLRARSGEGGRTVTNRVGWTYTGPYDSLPINVGDSIGWITLTDQTAADPAFCSVAPTSSPTSSPTKLVTAMPTSAPVAVTNAPTSSPTKSPSSSPTQAPTSAPIAATDSPSSSPTKSPTSAPVAATNSPSSSPTKSPTSAPIAATDSPSSSPTKSPTSAPVAATDSPTKSPTVAVLPDPTIKPTLAPVITAPPEVKVPTTSPIPFSMSLPSKNVAKASKSDPMAKTVKQGDIASMPIFAKTSKAYEGKISSKSGSSSNNSLSTNSKQMKSKAGSKAVDAKAQKLSAKASKAGSSLSMMS